MGYSSKRGRRPMEFASKSAHGYVIKDPTVRAFLSQCNLPKRAGEVTIPSELSVKFKSLAENPIRHIIAIDGGYSEVSVQSEFPSATVCFFQFGALIFSIDDLNQIAQQSFIDPEDMAKLKRIQRLKLTLPTRNVSLKSEGTLTNSVRRAINDFFQLKMEDGSLMDTLRWFVFQEYDTPLAVWTLSSCPVCHKTEIPLHRNEMKIDFTFVCPYCGSILFLSDVFRLHEAIDDELGAGGILGYVTTTLEQLILVHLIRIILRTKPTLLRQVQFIKDGPLGFFGQTANMHKPMRALIRYLFDHHTIFLAGLEKSGPFVEHADEITQRLSSGTVLILNNEYIYKHILPGKADPTNPYGRSTNYGNKVIFKTPTDYMYVVSLPTRDTIADPSVTDFPNFDAILSIVEKLKCDMYDDSLVPIALVNKLVSLANHPSSKILQKFAIDLVNH